MPASAEKAWEARGSLDHAAELLDDSHLIVRILGCPACGQRFLSVFTEEVDWVDSDDSQYWSPLPITLVEAVDLAQRGGEQAALAVNSLAPGRRCLQRSYPKGGEARVYWR
jgi:hypothetical protein